MAGSWQVVFFVLVLTCDCATIRNVLALEPKETLTRTRIKSEAQNCHVLEPGFNGLVFRAKVNNKISPGSWKYFKESLFVSSSRMEIDWTHPMWIPVEINYFKTEVSFGPDRHALKVKVGKSVDKNLITRWWRTHSYEGFAVEAEGPVKILFNCNPSSAKAESVIDTEGQAHTVLIASLCGCFLLVVGSATLYFLIMRRSPLLQDYPGNTPTSLTLPENYNGPPRPSFLQRAWGVVCSLVEYLRWCLAWQPPEASLDDTTFDKVSFLKLRLCLFNLTL
ncbi:hypothetical protein E2C01_038964 [Portunus trituberculatus]|uniref:Uncharacterized protein n=1 Tax=Portunus trituberculatus TaxID=210409 RepID=A0A5B7FJC9_PORTR|nr:hypothetical protein [Portunus trituberculatus]